MSSANSSSRPSTGLAVVIGSGYSPPPEMLQRLSSDGHFEGCSGVSNMEDPLGWTSQKDYEGKAVAGAYRVARRKGLDSSNYTIVTQYGDFPQFGGFFYIVRLLPGALPADSQVTSLGSLGVLTTVAEPTFPYHCEQCGESSSIEESDFQRLTGAEKAQCAKLGLDPSVTVRVDCPACGQSALVNRVTLVHDPVQARPQPKRHRPRAAKAPERAAIGATALAWRRIGRYVGLTVGCIAGGIVAHQRWGPSQIVLGCLGGLGVGVFAGEIIGFCLGLFAGYHRSRDGSTASTARSARGGFTAQCTSCRKKIPMQQRSLIGQWRSCPACGASFQVEPIHPR